MLTQKAHTSERTSVLSSKIRDYAQLTKLRLSALVVFSAFSGYWLAADFIVWKEVFFLVVGGFLVTGASNGLNQVWERHSDLLMSRTGNRPLPAGRMQALEATIFSGILGFIGVAMLWIGLNPLSGILGFLALFMYVALYTPLKKITPWAVFVGAFPGAIPPMLGWVAATGEFGLAPGLLFMVQFFWQFPHFWAIAWKTHDDYAKAGINLLPSGRRDRASSFQALIWTLFLIPVSLTPVWFGITGYLAGALALAAGLWFLWKAWNLYRTNAMDMATKLMFASFIYLPIIQIVYVIDKL